MGPRQAATLLVIAVTGLAPLCAAAKSDKHVDNPAAADADLAEADHGEGGHGEVAHGVDALNWFDFSNPDTPPLVPMFANFAVLLVIVYLILRKPIRGSVKDRRKNLETALNKARKRTAETEQALAEARSKIEALDLEMAKLRKEILDAGQAESKRINAEAEQRAERLKADTAALVGQEAERMARSIRAQVVAQIMHRAEALVQAKIQASDQERLAREYLDKMNNDVPERPGH